MGVIGQQATQLIRQVIYNGSALTSDITQSLPPVEKNLCFEVLRYYYWLSDCAKLLLTKPLKERDGDIYCVILIGLYQLAYSSRPAHAVVNDTVSLVKKLKKNWASGLVNAVLRNYIRQKPNIDEKLSQRQEAQTAHPQWFIDHTMHQYPNDWQSIITANNQQAPMFLRVNQQKISREDYLQLLKENTISASEVSNQPTAILLTQALSVNHLPGFDDGFVSVQDISAQHAATLLDLKPGLSVLDACAAPGGKTCHIAETQSQLSRLTALEHNPQRAERIEENLSRLQLHAEIKIVDACETNTWWNHEQYDRILIDTPCSGTGVIRRHPDIKLLRRESDINQFAKTQYTLLNSLWPLLKKDGILVYCTCSVLSEENEDVIAQFLQNHPDASPQPITLPTGSPRKHGWQILPNPTSGDGFYYAKIAK